VARSVASIRAGFYTYLNGSIDGGGTAFVVTSVAFDECHALIVIGELNLAVRPIPLRLVTDNLQWLLSLLLLYWAG
jgi:hypothetical protein